MKTLSLYFIFSMLTGNPILAIILVFLFYGVIDKMYFRFLPDFFAPFKRNKQINSLIREIRVNPSNAKASMDLGILYFEKKSYLKALDYLEKAKVRIDDSARLFSHLGMSYYEAGKSAEGIEHINRALELDKGVCYGLPYVYLFDYELSTGRDKDRLAEIEQNSDRYANTENLYRIGKVFRNKGYKAEAREMFQHSLNTYSYCPRNIKKMHRKWAFLSWMNKVTI